MCPRFGKGLLTPIIIRACPTSSENLWTASSSSPLGFEESPGVSEGRIRLGVSSGCVTVTGSRWLDTDEPYKGAAGREQGRAFLCPTLSRAKVGWAPHSVQGAGGGGLCKWNIIYALAACPPPLPPRSSPLLWIFPASGSGEVQWASVPSKGCLLPHTSPHSRSSKRSQSGSHSSPRSFTQGRAPES